VRGVVLSVKEAEYVLAARSFGASDLYLFRKHILPSLWGVLLTQFSIYIPQYILAEVTLSFLGLGVSEPIASWGNMLGDLQLLVSDPHWWLFAPAFALFGILLAYHGLFTYIKKRTL
jgi:ABC-type dipeptide/oligopeptide/nickel transport system permease subunit